MARTYLYPSPTPTIKISDLLYLGKRGAATLEREGHFLLASTEKEKKAFSFWLSVFLFPFAYKGEEQKEV